MSYVTPSPTITINRVLDAFAALGQYPKHHRSKDYYSTNDPSREDNNPSLLFGETESGGVWFKDMAGISDRAAILRALKLDPNSPTVDAPQFTPRQAKQKRRLRLDFNHPDATYHYVDSDGQPVYQVRRVNYAGGKEFRQYRWEDGRWQPGRGDTPELLYNLPGVARAEVVLIVEGEKDADNLNRLGYVATCHAGGAKTVDKALAAYKTWLHDKRVIILPDNDEPGRGMANTLAGELSNVSIVDPSAWGGNKADVSDLVSRLRGELLEDSTIRTTVDAILADAAPYTPPVEPWPWVQSQEEYLAQVQAEKEAARASILANRPPPLVTLEFETPIPEAELDKCEITIEHHTWAAEGRGHSYQYCNDAKRCALCRERMTTKLRYYLEEIALFAYVDENGNAAYSQPGENEAGEFVANIVGSGVWYVKLLDRDERRNFRDRYRRACPGGFIAPEIYAVDDMRERFVALSLAPFEDMEPTRLTDDLLQRIVIGCTGAHATLLFAPPRKQLERALPRYTFEIPKYLHDKGIVATVPAAHSVLFTGPITKDDIYSSFNTRAETFDEIGLILEEVAMKSVDSDRLRGTDDHAPDYVIQSIQIVPEAKPAYLAVWNAGRKGDKDTVEKFKRRNLPKMPTLADRHVDKGIYRKFYMPLSTYEDTTRAGEAAGSPGYYARLEHLLEIGAI